MTKPSRPTPSWQPEVEAHVEWAVDRHHRLQAVGLFSGLDADTVARVERRDIVRYFRARDADDWRVLQEVEDAPTNLSRAYVEALRKAPAGNRAFELQFLPPVPTALEQGWACLDDAGIQLANVHIAYSQAPDVTLQLQLGSEPPRDLVSVHAGLPLQALNTALAWAGHEVVFVRLLDPADTRYLVMLVDAPQLERLDAERLIERLPPV